MFLGIDPGKSGALALLDGTSIETHSLADGLTATAEWFESNSHRVHQAVLEKVHSMPGQGVSSTFKFGTSYGQLQALLVANHIPYILVAPQVWQRVMDCRTGGDKNITKRAAQVLHPELKVTHRTADAILLAHYASRLND